MVSPRPTVKSSMHPHPSSVSKMRGGHRTHEKKVGKMVQVGARHSDNVITRHFEPRRAMGQHNHFGCMRMYACMGVPICMCVHACVHACACMLAWVFVHAWCVQVWCACACMASRVRYATVHSHMMAWHAPMPFRLSCHAAGQHARCTLLAHCWHNMQACMPETCMRRNCHNHEGRKTRQQCQPIK